jgi:hypothetical protein
MLSPTEGTPLIVVGANPPEGWGRERSGVLGFLQNGVHEFKRRVGWGWWAAGQLRLGAGRPNYNHSYYLFLSLLLLHFIVLGGHTGHKTTHFIVLGGHTGHKTTFYSP